MSRYGDDPVHARRWRADRRNVAELMNVIAVRAAVDSGLHLMPDSPAAPSPAVLPRQRAPRPDRIPQQRITPPEE